MSNERIAEIIQRNAAAIGWAAECDRTNKGCQVPPLQRVLKEDVPYLLSQLAAKDAEIERLLEAQRSDNAPLTETERTVASMIEDECMRESLAGLCKRYGVTEADFFGFLYRNTPEPGKEG